MIPRKFLILFVLISIAGHALVLALTHGVEWSAAPRAEKVITVELKPDQAPAARSEPARQTPRPTETGVGPLREDTVALQDPDSRYRPYLLTIRRKIEDLWIYPPQALVERREGSARIRFTIAANGTLSDCRILATSGSPILDGGALAVVRDSAPYAPLPADFRLARLHITAVFSYRLNP
jgi:TonB family protein